MGLGQRWKNLMISLYISTLLSFSSLIIYRELYGGLKDVLVPEMYSDLTSQRVLMMEWVEVVHLLNLFPILCNATLFWKLIDNFTS